MASPEGIRPRHGILRITSAPPREAPVPVLPRPGVRTPPEVVPNKPVRKGGLSKKTRITLASLAVLGTIETLGAVSTETHNEQPVSIQTIPADLAWPRTIVEDFLKGLKGPEAPPTFDNKLDKGVIGTNNITRMPQAEIDKQFPSAFAKLNDGKNTLQLEYPFDLSSSPDPNAQLTFTKSFSGLGSVRVAERPEYERQGFYDAFTFHNVPAGTIILSPVDGYLVFIRDETQLPTDPNLGKYLVAAIDFLAPNGNHYRIAIGGSTTLKDGTRTAYTLNPLIDAPEFKPKEDRYKAIGDYGIAIKKGQPIVQLASPIGNSPIEEVGFNIAGARKGEADKPAEHSQPYIPTNLELFTTPDGKIISPQR